MNNLLPTYFSQTFPQLRKLPEEKVSILFQLPLNQPEKNFWVILRSFKEEWELHLQCITNLPRLNLSNHHQSGNQTQHNVRHSKTIWKPRNTNLLMCDWDCRKQTWQSKSWTHLSLSVPATYVREYPSLPQQLGTQCHFSTSGFFNISMKCALTVLEHLLFSMCTVLYILMAQIYF